MIIDDRHHVYAKTSHKDVQLAEVGPRFEAKRRFHIDWRLTLSIRDSTGDYRSDRGGRRVVVEAIYADRQEEKSALDSCTLSNMLYSTWMHDGPKGR